MKKKLDNPGRELPKKKKEGYCWVGIWQNYCMDRTTKGLTRNIGMTGEKLVKVEREKNRKD